MASSAVRRITQGSALNWVKIFISIGIQIAATPIYLTFWTSGQFGAWLAIQACVSLFQIPGGSHQVFVGNELLKTYQVQERIFFLLLRTGVAIGAVYALCEAAAGAGVAIWLPKWIKYVSGGDGVAADLAWSFLILLLGSGLIWNWAGIWTRAAIARGHYVLAAWLGLAEASICPIGPLVFLPLGIGVIGAAWATLAVTLPVHLAGVYLLRGRVMRDVRAEDEHFKVDWRLGLSNLVRSQVLSGVNAVALLRQQGVRLILGPMSGADSVAAFSTLRTGANLALRGLSTITSPLMPELMRFLNQRDQPRSEAAFATVWIMLVGLMAPAVVVLQAFAGPLFEIWTRGKIPFDPALFAVLSLGVLVYALAQPPMAVVSGNNLLRPQIVISMLAAAITVGGMFLLVPRIGILGAGVALLAAELASTFAVRIVTRVWLRDNGMTWPGKQYGIASASVWIAAFGMGSIVAFPAAKWILLPVCIGLLSWNLWRYWQALPEIATQKARLLLAVLPGVRRLFVS